MIMVKISPWGLPNLQYLDIGVAGQKGWETLLYSINVLMKNPLCRKSVNSITTDDRSKIAQKVSKLFSILFQNY